MCIQFLHRGSHSKKIAIHIGSARFGGFNPLGSWFFVGSARVHFNDIKNVVFFRFLIDNQNKMGKGMEKDNNIIADGIAEASVYAERKLSDGKQWKDNRFSLEKGYSYWMNAKAVRMFTNGCELPKDIPPLYCGYMYRCATMLQASTNMIVKHHKNYDRPITTKQLAEELGISTRSCQYFIKSMIDRDILRKQDGHLYVNPIFFIRGRYLSWQLYTLFSDQLDAFLPQWVIDRFNGDVNA